ncbi:MAG TPA: FimV/HubP family polar landmark protein [Xanthomonadaceae bacterium]|nr:FimV/HubP family polar landmark protein [Xanthomonadaceae bacterium]
MRKAGMLGVAMALLLAMAPAHALDVDRIEIRSALGEPLLAEIPITGATPQDLQQLQAQLASATTFARIGLPRPQGVVADLRFEVVRGPRALIRVTSTLPVEEDFLTFLVQVDAPQGRLVREYSVSLGAAPTLAAPVEPQIQMPVQAADNAIARQPDPADALPAPLEPAIVPLDNAPPAALATPAPIPLHADQRPESAPPRPKAAPVTGRPQPSRAPRTQANSAAVPGSPVRSAVAVPAAGAARRPGDYTVRPGDTLTRIVERMPLAGVTPPQAMLALLRTNPHAFGSGNINLLQRGAVLRVPAPAELTRLDAVAAETMVRLQIQQWRSGDMPPVESVEAPSGSVDRLSSSRPTARVAPARLELAPSADAAALASGSGPTRQRDGTAADRERAAADLVATRYTEFQQMQQRIAELEQAQKAQQRLIELKNRQLAAQQPRSAGMWPWLIAALALGMAVAAFWRRARPGSPGRVARRLSAMVRGPN